MSETKTVNEMDTNQIVNRFPKLSEQQKLILEWLSMDHGYLDLAKRTSGEITFGVLRLKHGVEPYDADLDWHELQRSKWCFIKPWGKLPHFIAQLKKGGDPTKLTVDDIYDFDYGKAHVKKELLTEAAKIRASVCRSLKRLLERGLIVQLHVTECYNFMGVRRPMFEKNYYFISKEQGKKTIDARKVCSYKGQWKFNPNKR